MESRRMVLINLFAGNNEDADRKQTSGHTGRGVGEEGDGGMYGNSNMETFLTICKTDSHWQFAV